MDSPASTSRRLWTGLLCCLSLIWGCRTTESPTSAATPSSNIEASNDDEDQESWGMPLRPSGDAPRPRSPSSWDVKKLLMTWRSTINLNAVDECRATVKAVSQEAESQEDMMRAVDAMTAQASREPLNWHWCFYALIFDLDTTMQKTSSLLDQMAPEFFTRMRQLWIMSTALDGIHKGNTYFALVRRRYIDMSRDIFGRNVEVSGPPMGNLPTHPQGPQSKPAGRFDESQGRVNGP